MTRDQVKQEVLSPPGKTAVSAASRVESVEELTETSDSKQCVDILANGMIKQEQVNHLEMCSMFIEAAGNEGSKCVCVPAFSYLAGGLGKSNMKSENWEENEEDVVKSEEFEGEELPFIMTTKCEDMTGFKTDHLEDKDAIDGLDDIIKTEEHFAEEDTVVNSYDSTWSSFCRPKVERVHPPVARHDCEDKMTVEDCRGGDSFLLDKELLDASMDTVVSVCRVSLTATDSCVRAEERPGNSQTFNSTHQETNETPTRSDNVFQPTKHYASESIENQNFEETFSDFNTELSIFEHPWDNYSKHGTLREPEADINVNKIDNDIEYISESKSGEFVFHESSRNSKMPGTGDQNSVSLPRYNLPRRNFKRRKLTQNHNMTEKTTIGHTAFSERVDAVEASSQLSREELARTLKTCSYVLQDEVSDTCPLGHYLDPTLATFNIHNYKVTASCTVCEITVYMGT